MIFGINTTSDISKLLYVISWAVRRVKFETILKYHEWYLYQISLQITLLFVYTTTHKRFVIFTCRYFKLSWNTPALSQSNCRNFSRSSIKPVIRKVFCSQVFIRLLYFALQNFTVICEGEKGWGQCTPWTYRKTVANAGDEERREQQKRSGPRTNKYQQTV